MSTLYVMCGLSFSGKTTLARAIAESTGSAFVSYDELWETAERDPALTGLDEWRFVVGLVHEGARRELREGRSVVVDNLNEERVDRDLLRAIADEEGADTVVVHVETPLDVIERRRRENAKSGARGHTGTEQFEFVRARFEPPARPERFVRYRHGEDVGAWLARLPCE